MNTSAIFGRTTHAIALALLTLVCSCAKKPTDVDEINAVFQKFRIALLEVDNEAAWSLLDAEAQNFYSSVLRDALAMSRRRLNEINLTHKFVVLRLRAELTRDELQNATGKDILGLAVKNEWLPKAFLESTESFKAVGVQEGHASAWLSEFPNTPAYYFTKQDGVWKIAPTKSFAFISTIMRQIQAERRQTDREYVMQTLQFIAKYEVDEKIWDGPLETINKGPKTPTAIDRQTFSMSLPYGWSENTANELYDRDAMVFFAGPESCFVNVTVGNKAAGATIDLLLEHQKQLLGSKFTEARLAEFSSWATNEGKGIEIEGKFTGLMRSRVRLFGFESTESVCVIVEFGALPDLKAFSSDFEQIQQTFRLKP
jgi:hypothetical protein